MSLPWIIKHAPKKFEEFIGNEKVVSFVKKWCQNWRQNKKEKPLLFYGPPGVGKTALAYVVANECGWHVLELNASDFRTKETFEKLELSSSSNYSLFGGRQLILIDEVDGMQSADKGGITELAKFLKASKNPVILTANDIWKNKKLSLIRDLCTPLEFKNVNTKEIYELLERIAKKEGLSYEKEALYEIAKRSRGDVRGAILDLEALSKEPKITKELVATLGYREKQQNIFLTLAYLFRAKNALSATMTVSNSDVDLEMVSLWIEENLPKIYKGKDLEIAFDWLSRADRFRRYIISQQNWKLLKYYSFLLSTGVVFMPSQKEKGFIKFNYPKVLRLLSKESGTKRLLDSIANKIKEKVRGSKRKIYKYEIPFLHSLLILKPELEKDISEYFEFTKEEIVFLKNLYK